MSLLTASYKDIKLSWLRTEKIKPILRMYFTVSVLGREEGYTVKFAPSPSGTPDGEGVYLTIYIELSPNTDSISFEQSLGS